MPLNADNNLIFDLVYKIGDIVHVVNCCNKTRSNINDIAHVKPRFKQFEIKRIDISINQDNEVTHLIGDTDRYMGTNQANMYKVEDCYSSRELLIASLN